MFSILRHQYPISCKGYLSNHARKLLKPKPQRHLLSTFARGQHALLSQDLKSVDPAVHSIIEKEKARQQRSLNLVPSENLAGQAVLEGVGSVMHGGNSEGYPGARFYSGIEFLDEVEILCQQRALETFGLNEEEWGVNVQALSGTPANLSAYSAVMNTHDRLMGLDLAHGGHLSHGYQTPSKKVTGSSKYFESFPYRLDESTGLIDYDRLESNALLYRPKIIIAGASAYTRLIDYARMKQIADQIGAYLLADMSHISGLVAANAMPSPFPSSDIVTTTTHKSLRGPRGAMIFYRKGVRKPAKDTRSGVAEYYNLENAINSSVFPGHHGAPHNHNITALATALRQVQTPEFKEYAHAVVANAGRLAKALGTSNGTNEGGYGYKVVSEGTDNHIVLLDLRDQEINGARVQRVLELCSIVANKNTVPGDKSAINPGGIRLGSPVMTSRGFGEAEFDLVATMVHRAICIAKDIDARIQVRAKEMGLEKPRSMEVFERLLADGMHIPAIRELREEVEELVLSFPVPWEQ